MRISVLGALEVLDESGLPVPVSGRRLRALLVLLALEGGRPVPAQRLIEALWSRQPPAQAANALQSLVSRLRAVFGKDRVLARDGGYLLPMDGVHLDVTEFAAGLAQGRAALAAGEPDRAAATLRTALALWRGPALADLAVSAAAEAEAVRLEQQRLAATEVRIEAELALGKAAELIPELESLRATEPLRERLPGLLMRALAASGRQAEAIAVYHETRTALAEQLGVDPSAELERVYLDILRGKPAVEVDRIRTNLRAERTSFVGREADTERVLDRLRHSRLVTLTGPGGAGKTRLAVESAARLFAAVSGGVWLVELAPVTEPSGVAAAALAVLGGREPDLGPVPGSANPAGELAVLDQLANTIADRELLIVLDNCEHLIEAASRCADRLLGACPRLRILATSREPLNTAGESLCPVPPLELPAQHGDTAQIAASPAVRLFADRAGLARPGFRVDADNAADVGRICRRLDGVPLAIELAAARLRALSVRQIVVRLDDRFSLLTAGSRTVLPRHKTLRAVVEWSWELLDDAERTVASRLSVFSGGAPLDALERLCADTVPDVLGVLAGLVDKSLLTTQDDADVRFGALETIRAYTAEQLARSGDTERIRAAHAEYFLRLAEYAEPRLRTGEQVRWLRRLTVEQDNMYAALRWSIEHGDARTAVRFAAALGQYWVIRGHHREGVDLATAALALPGEVPREASALAQVNLLMNRRGAGQFGVDIRPLISTAIELAEQSDSAHPILRIGYPLLRLFESIYHPEALDATTVGRLTELTEDADPWVRASAHVLRCQLHLNAGRPADAERDSRTAWREYLAIGDRWRTCSTLAMLAEALSSNGDHHGAVSVLDEAARLITELGHTRGLTPVWLQSAQELWLLGESARAREFFSSALRSARQVGSNEQVATALCGLGELARFAGDLDDASVHFGRARSLGADGPLGAQIHTGLGHVLAAQGDLSGALEHHLAALRAIEGQDVLADIVFAGLADIALRRGDAGAAAMLLGAGGVGGPAKSPSLAIPRMDEVTARVHAELGHTEFAAALLRGAALSKTEALAVTGMRP